MTALQLLPPSGFSPAKTRLFLSYGRKDAKELADRLRTDLESHGYEVWQDTRRVQAGRAFEEEIADGLKSTQIVIVLLSPHAVRTAMHSADPSDIDSVVLDEICFARFSHPPKPIVPVMAEPTEPPFCIFRLDYVDMCTWRADPHQYETGFRRLLDAIEAARRGETRYRWWDARLAPCDFARFIHEKRREFSGRDWLFAEIETWRQSGAGRALLIVGDPGIGKSALVAQLVHLNPHNRVLAYHCCQSATQETLDPSRFVRSLAAMTASNLGEYAEMLAEPAVEEALSPESCARDPGSAFERGFLAPLEYVHAPESGPRFLLIDSLDEALLRHRGLSTIVDVLAGRLERLPDWLRIVATTRRDKSVLERLAGLRATQIDAQDRRNFEDIEAFVFQKLRDPEIERRAAANGQRGDELASLIVEKSEGNFLFVRQLFDGLLRDVQDFRKLAAIPPGLGGLYLTDLKSRFADEASFAQVRAVLETLVAAQRMLPEDLLADCTGLSAQEELPRVLRKISVYLRSQETESGTLEYTLYHRSFADWLTDGRRGDGLYYASELKGHERLALACWNAYDVSEYARAHLPTHLTGTGDWERLLTLCTRRDKDLFSNWTEGGRWEQGQACLQGLLCYLEKRPKSALIRAGLRTQLARIYSLRGDYALAESLLNDALHDLPRRHSRRVRAVALHELGSLELYRTEFDAAKRFYERAVSECLRGVRVHHDGAAISLIGLATVELASGASPGSIHHAERAYRHALKAGDVRGQVAAQRVLASAFKMTGRYEDADRILNEALSMCAARGLGTEKGRLLMVLGWLRHDQATFKKEISKDASTLFEEALRTSREVGDIRTNFEAQVSLAWQMLVAKQVKLAGDHLGPLRRARAEEMHPDLAAGIAVAFAVELHLNGELQASEQAYRESIAYSDEKLLRNWKYRALIGLGSVQWHRGEHEPGQKSWDEAVRTAESISPAKRELVRISIEMCKNDSSEAPRA